MKRLPIPLTDDQHNAIKIKAAQTRLPAAEIARRFLLAWLRGELELPRESEKE